jgi:HK97 family phage portal protein
VASSILPPAGAIPAAANVVGPLFYGAGLGVNVSPTTINEYSILSIPAYWRAVNFLADNLAAFGRSVHLDEARIDVPHRLDTILKRRPNGYQNPTAFWRTFIFHCAHLGNGYARIRRSELTGEVTLHNLMPHDVCPFRYTPDGEVDPQQYYYVLSAKEVLLASDVLHIAALSYDGLQGLDTVYLFSDTYQRGKTLDKFMLRYLMKGTVMRGAIELPAEASPEQVEEIVKTLTTYFVGADAERDMIVLSGGAKLNNATLSPQDSQLIQQGAYTTKQIAQITGVPPQFLYEFHESKYNNSVEQMGQDVVRYTFRPWIGQIGEECSLKLLTPSEQDRGYSVRLDPNDLLKGDTAAITAAMVEQTNAGIRKPNEARAVLGLPDDADPDSDRLHRLGNTDVQLPKDDSIPAQKASQAKPDALKALQPIIDATSERIDQKASNAFATKEGKPAHERLAWGNVFAETQSAFAAEQLAPVSASIVALGGEPLPIDLIRSRYQQEIKRAVTTNERKPLAEIVSEAIRGTNGTAE